VELRGACGCGCGCLCGLGAAWGRQRGPAFEAVSAGDFVTCAIRADDAVAWMGGASPRGRLLVRPRLEGGFTGDRDATDGG
jgi:hypothetical protein